jgi:UDP-N-acetyl-2-amino-2-deoxyglucuronate dehydrogenase
MSPLRTALIGCGKVGQIHAQALRELPESEFVAVCDPVFERAESLAQPGGARAFVEVGPMLRDTRPQVVLIATPHPQHAAPAMAAAEAGAHVLVEKPLAANLRDCDAMLDAARRGGVQLSVISQRRWYLPVRRMKAAVEAGQLGRPVLGVFQMLSWRDPAYYASDPWRGKWDTEGGGVLVNQSPHHLDLLQWLMGDVEEISGYWANLNHPCVDVDDTAVATIRFRSGGLGAIVSSLSQRPGIYTKVHIHGSNGASVGVQTDTGATFVAGVSGIVEPPFNDLWTIPGEEHQLAQFQAEDRAAFQQVDGTSYYHRLQIQEFLRAVLDGRPAPVPGAEGRLVVAMFTAIYRSQREHRPIPFPLSS